jgi:DNA-binding NarL/FixJ family response regulator
MMAPVDNSRPGPLPPGRPIRILLVDDAAAVRAALCSALGGDPGCEVVGQAANGLDAISEARRLDPDVVVMDLAMPVMDGIESTRRITAESPGTAVIGLSISGDELHRKALLEAGGKALVDKGCPLSRMKLEIRRHGPS